VSDKQRALRNQKCIQNIRRETMKENFRDLGIDWKIILKRILQKMVFVNVDWIQLIYYRAYYRNFVKTE
jgi:signal recognition particle subunit SEC65